MLFSRIYNWIKYKTLPPSLLFTNRLFVERDSKHRRVVSNFGLTFRNSKWSSYSRVNVNTTSRTNYIRLISYVFLILLLLSFLYSYPSYYDSNLLPNTLYTLLWFIFDADIYLKTALVSSILCLSQLLFSTVHQSFLEQTTNEISNTKPIPRHLHKALLYQYLTSAPNPLNLENLVNTAEPEKESLFMLGLTTNLYQTINLLNQSNTSYAVLKQSLTTLESNSIDMSRYLVTKQGITSLELDYLLFNKTTSATPKSFNELTHWTLDSLNTETNRYSTELSTKTGLFYAANLNYTSLQSLMFENTELSGLRTSITNQLTSIRQQRWLYRYNILHRAVLKNSHHLTLTKKLINSGFFNSSLTTRNIWAASNLTALSKNSENNSLTQTSLKSIYNSTYGHYLSPENTTKNHLTHSPNLFNSSSLFPLNNYETSYHWFLQRFYQFNSLSSEKFSLSPSVRKGSTSLKTRSVDQLTNSTVLFDILASSTSNINLTSSIDNSLTKSDYYLHYCDYNTLTKIDSEQFINLAKNKTGLKTYYYNPSEIQSTSLPEKN